MRDVTPRIFVWVLALIIGAPLAIQCAADVMAGTGLRILDVFRRAPTAENLRAYENGLSDALLVARAVRPRYTELVDRALRRGNGKVVEAKGDWLVYAGDLTFVSAPGLAEIHATDAHHTEVLENRPLDAILDYHRQLAAAGIALVVVAVPEKATIYPERLVPGLRPDLAPNNRDLVTSLEWLAAQGIMVIELTQPMLEAKARGVELFLPLDTHWSPDGAQLSAEFVAARVRTLPAYRELPGPRAEFDHLRVAFERRGDLYGMLSYAERGAVFPARELVLDQVLPLPGQPPPTAARHSPILVLGDSFTVIYGDSSLGMGRRGGFAEHLADELGVPLDVIAIPAGGANRAREALALRREGIAEKRIVVWQFAERDLLNKDVHWTHVPLPTRKADAGAVGEGARGLAVRARLTGTSTLPERLPYGDCLLIMRYEPLDASAHAAQPLFVAAWGRRDWKPAPASRYEVGAKHDLVLVPARERIELERTCFSDNVDMHGNLYWADSISDAP